MTSAEIASVFDATRSEFAKVTPQVWGPAGQALAFQARLRPGDAVLDICCGAGASALPAAAAIGRLGVVHAIDLADELLEQGRVVASDRALQNVHFVKADATQWEPPSEVGRAGYDALLSSFGVFFLPRMDSSWARLTRLVHDGGRVGVSVWRNGALDEFATAFFDVIGSHLPGEAGGRPVTGPRAQAARLDTVDKLATWLATFGLEQIEVNELSNLVPATAEFAWDFVLGSGFRAPLAQFDLPTVHQIRADFVDLLTERGVHTVDATTLIGTASRPRR